MVVVAMDMMYQTSTRAVLSSSCSSSCSSSAAVAKVNVQQQLWQQQSWSAGSGSHAFLQKSKDEHLATGFLGCGGTQRLLLCFKGEAAAERGRGRVLLGSSNNNGPASVVAMASSSSKAAAAKEEYEAELEKPFGLRFYKGSDGGTYIDAIAPGGSADKTKLFTPGDRVIATSAVFGNEMWPAAEYGRTMYTVRQRIGTLAIKMEKRYGVREDRGVSAEVLSAERNAGSIGEGIREIQVQNYLRKMELKKQREEELAAGLELYKAAKYDAALEKFETVLGLKPEAREEAVASYNVACCYSQLKQIDGALSALEQAMEAGFDNYKTVRQDPDLANVRASPGFLPLINKYDEPFINENAVNALKSVFGLFGKK
ncbi:hypothetical protein BDL97_06G098900 [Sphagnum fallax]|nr:hypothetical protein BDL97_06G098900 [Sphagnum fallax]